MVLRRIVSLDHAACHPAAVPFVVTIAQLPAAIGYTGGAAEHRQPCICAHARRRLRLEKI
jgi:hypothetical protein